MLKMIIDFYKMFFSQETMFNYDKSEKRRTYFLRSLEKDSKLKRK